MTDDCILALDQGTSSSRAVAFAGGGVVALAQRELPASFPHPGWVEHDPLRIWTDQLAVAREAWSLAADRGQSPRAIGITNQRETVVLWDRASGEPLHPAIVWQDRRTAAACEALRAQGLGEAVAARSGLVLDPYFSATKIRWLLDEIPGARQRAARGELACGTIDSWLLWLLTGGADPATRAHAVHATDVTNASRTMLWNLHRACWDDELLALFDVPRDILPEVAQSARVWGHTAPGLFPESIPIAALVGDQQAALFGQGCARPGLAKNTYGTGCFLLAHTGRHALRSAHGLLTTAAAAPPGQPPAYALEGSVFVGGAVVQWLRDGLRAIGASSEVEALARSVPDSGGVSFVPAFTGLGAPWWRPDARGAIMGLTRGSTNAHIARAALESVAFQSAALLRAMDADLKAADAAPVTELRVDGGAAANDLLMQFQADLLGIPVLRPAVLETTAQGAAWLAALGCGLSQGVEELEATLAAPHRFEPLMGRDEARARIAVWESALEALVGSHGHGAPSG